MKSESNIVKKKNKIINQTVFLYFSNFLSFLKYQFFYIFFSFILVFIYYREAIFLNLSNNISDFLFNYSFISFFIAFFKTKSFILFEIFFPEFVIALWIIFLLLVFIIKYNTVKSNNSFFLWYMIKKSFLIMFILMLISLYFFIAFYSFNVSVHYKGFISDFYVHFVKFFIFYLAILAIGSCYFYYQNFNKTYIFEIPIIFSFLIFFLMFLISSFDFMSIFFCTEGVTFVLVTMLIYNYNYEDSTFAAVKYLVLASISAGLFGFGSALTFGFTGSTNFYFVREFINKFLIYNTSNSKSLLSVILVFLILGIFFKLAIAPMHQWSITIYSTSNWGLIFLFSTVVKVAFFSVFFRFLYYVFFDCSNFWVPILSFGALISLFVGSFGAISSYNLKFFVAYSSLSQLGFVILGLLPANIISLASSSMFLFYYVIAMSCFFLIIVFFTIDYEKFSTDFLLINSNRNEASGTNKNYFNLTVDANFFFKDLLILSFNSLLNLSKRPLPALCFSIAIVNLAGLPPFPGFFSKFFILMSLMHSKFFFYVIVALVFNLFSVFYYLRILMLVWINFLSNNSPEISKYLLDKLPAWGDFEGHYFNFIFLKKNRLLSIFLALLSLFLLISSFFISEIWTATAVILSKGSFYFLNK